MVPHTVLLSSPQPTSLSQTCGVTSGGGTLAGINITTVSVQCVTDMANLSVTKTDGQQILVPGDPITYMITVTNNGPFAVVGASVQDTLPGELMQGMWECFPGAGASCNTPGNDNIDELVDIPSGSSVSYVLTAATDPGFEGVINNTVMVTAPSNITDPEPGDNSATDTSSTEGMFMDGFEDSMGTLKRWLEEILAN